MNKRIIFAILAILILGFIYFIFNFYFSEKTTEVRTISQSIKNCGSEVDKKGSSTHSLDRDCFVEAFNTCTPAKISEESFPPDNAPSITTIIQVEGKTEKGCRVQVNIHNTLAIPENNIYYCYNAEKGRADDTLNKDHLLINNCDNGKSIIY